MADKPLSFASEEDRLKAIADLPETRENIERIREMRQAPIDAAAGAAPPGGSAEPAKPPEAPDETFTVKRSEIPLGYKNVGEAMKALEEKEALIARQQEYIRGRLQQSVEPPGEPVDVAELRRRLEQAESALKAGSAAPSASPAGPPPSSVGGDIAGVQKAIDTIEARIATINKEMEADPDNYLGVEYQRELLQLQAQQASNIKALSGLYSNALAELGSVKAQAQEAGQYLRNTVEERKRKEADSALDATFAEMDGLAKDKEFADFQVPKSYKAIEGDFINWRDQLATAYYQRPARNTEEKVHAYQQYQLHNPELLERMKMTGVAVEPGPEIRRYLDLCQAYEYMEGWRQDPVTGQAYRLQRYDPATRQNVPLRLPSVKAALQQMRLENGHYQKEKQQAYQEGARSFAEASARRDRGAVELTSRDQGGSADADLKWALNLLQDESREVEMMKKIRAGDKETLAEINKARQIVGMPAMVVNY